MKIFTQESVIEEVASGMESNLVKNAFAEQQVETSHRYHALERLAEAAGLFEKAGNIEKAAQLTDLINSLSNNGKSRDQAIKNKIASLESVVNKLQKVYDSESSETDRYLLNATANKITGLLANVTSTTSDILQSVANLKRGYEATPKTLEIIAAAVDVANGTLSVVAEQVQEDAQPAKDKKKKKDTDLVEVLKHFGFGLDGGSDCDSGDCGDKAMMTDDESEEQEYWEE